jgi:hypothetical protein
MIVISEHRMAAVAPNIPLAERWGLEKGVCSSETSSFYLVRKSFLDDFSGLIGQNWVTCYH